MFTIICKISLFLLGIYVAILNVYYQSWDPLNNYWDGHGGHRGFIVNELFISILLLFIPSLIPIFHIKKNSEFYFYWLLIFLWNYFILGPGYLND